jgi:hypothetical protein
MSIETRIDRIEQTLDAKENNHISTFADWIKCANTGRPYILTGSLKVLIDNIDTSRSEDHE